MNPKTQKKIHRKLCQMWTYAIMDVFCLKLLTLQNFSLREIHTSNGHFPSSLGREVCLTNNTEFQLPHLTSRFSVLIQFKTQSNFHFITLPLGFG